MRLSLALILVAALAVVLIPASVVADGSPGILGFKASNQMYSADGSFSKWQFTKVEIPDGDIEKGKVEIEVSLASVNEKTEALAEHLRQSDFFHVEKFATATITIDGAKKVGDNSYEAMATVDFHGHSGEVPVAFTVTQADPLRIEGEATLSRTAFGIGGEYDPANERSITDEVKITMDATVK